VRLHPAGVGLLLGKDREYAEQPGQSAEHAEHARQAQELAGHRRFALECSLPLVALQAILRRARLDEFERDGVLGVDRRVARGPCAIRGAACAPRERTLQIVARGQFGTVATALRPAPGACPQLEEGVCVLGLLADPGAQPRPLADQRFVRDVEPGIGRERDPGRGHQEVAARRAEDFDDLGKPRRIGADGIGDIGETGRPAQVASAVLATGHRLEESCADRLLC